MSRYFFTLFTSLCLLCFPPFSSAFSLDDLSNKEASSGLQAALERGAGNAVGKLGVAGGFMQNEKVKIPLPKVLEQAVPILKMTGQSGRLDELVLAMNTAAETAIPLAKPLLVKAVKSMTFADAKQILTGGETSVTEFFKAKTAAPLAEKFLPIVKGVTSKSGLATKYNSAIEKVGKFTHVPPEQATVEAYVTQRALDGLYLMIAEEEKAIRADPIGTGSKIIGKVFGLLK
ncbi:MAG: DUF4197 domain-containing protein [Burkholderiales bacterium]|nr:DUF4197 domain-containing protein [Burkholderiales bacterium]